MNPKKKVILKILGAVYLAMILLYFIVSFLLTGPHGGVMRKLDQSLVANNARLLSPLQLEGTLEITPATLEALLEAGVTAIGGAEQQAVLLGTIMPGGKIISDDQALGQTIERPIIPGAHRQDGHVTGGTLLTNHLWERVIDQPGMYDAENPPTVEASGISGIMEFDLTLVFIMLNFLGLFTLLYLALWDPMMTMLDKRAETVRNDLDTAAGRRQEADELKKQYGELMLSARQERQEMVQQGRHEGQKERDRIVDEAREESAKVLAQGKQDLEAEVGKVRTELRQEIGGMSVEIAERILGREVTDKDTDRLLEDFLAQVQQAELKN